VDRISQHSSGSVNKRLLIVNISSKSGGAFKTQWYLYTGYLMHRCGNMESKRGESVWNSTKQLDKHSKRFVKFAMIVSMYPRRGNIVRIKQTDFFIDMKMVLTFLKFPFQTGFMHKHRCVCRAWCKVRLESVYASLSHVSCTASSLNVKIYDNVIVTSHGHRFLLSRDFIFSCVTGDVLNLITPFPFSRRTASDVTLFCRPDGSPIYEAALRPDGKLENDSAWSS